MPSLFCDGKKYKEKYFYDCNHGKELFPLVPRTLSQMDGPEDRRPADCQTFIFYFFPMKISAKKCLHTVMCVTYDCLKCGINAYQACILNMKYLNIYARIIFKYAKTCIIFWDSILPDGRYQQYQPVP